MRALRNICSAHKVPLNHARKLKRCLGVQITSATLTPVIGMIKVCPLEAAVLFLTEITVMCTCACKQWLRHLSNDTGMEPNTSLVGNMRSARHT